MAAAPDAATLAAAQSTTAYEEPRSNPLPLPVIAVLLAVLGTMAYIAFIEDHHGGNSRIVPNSAGLSRGHRRSSSGGAGGDRRSFMSRHRGW